MFNLQDSEALRVSNPTIIKEYQSQVDDIAVWVQSLYILSGENEVLVCETAAGIAALCQWVGLRSRLNAMARVGRRSMNIFHQKSVAPCIPLGWVTITICM